MLDGDLHHDPVLLKEIKETLILPETRYFFDGTLGLGGHAQSILNSHKDLTTYIGCDLDRQHLEYAKQRLSLYKDNIQLHNMNFSDIGQILPTNRKGGLSVLLDLGICSNHVDDAAKGFSFSQDGPLNMSYASNPLENAESIINHYEERSLMKIFRDYGEDPAAFKLSKAISRHRTQNPIRTTYELRDIISETVRPQDLKKTLTRVFQAIRMEANEELHHLEKALEDGVASMESGDRMGVISYHSLEDRIVKKFFLQVSKPETKEGLYSLHEEVAPPRADLLTRKPIVPTEEETSQNPRARSAKYRVIEKR